MVMTPHPSSHGDDTTPYNTGDASIVCAGLDAATSKDILTVLNRLTQSGCSVLLTIHQPRIEIFHMFHKIVLFAEGQVAYFGSPFKAISYFTEKLQERDMHFKVCLPNTYACTYVRCCNNGDIGEGRGGKCRMCLRTRLSSVLFCTMFQ